MARAVDLLAFLLLALAGVAFVLGAIAITSHEDLLALYWLVAGSACLKASVDLLRPGSPA
jgi:hypothetical protein